VVIVGLKPTYGLISRYGLIAYASSLDQIGPFTRTVEDAGHIARSHRRSRFARFDFVQSRSARLPRRTLTSPWPMETRHSQRILRRRSRPRSGRGGRDGDRVYRSIGCEIREVSLPNTQYCLDAYYVIATAEASSNLARYDRIRYGHRAKDAKDVLDVYQKSRAEGFGDEVKRRIILGTYVLSSGYYDAYYLRAQKVRTLIRQDFLDAYREVDALITPTSPIPAFKLGEKSAEPLAMYLCDIYTIRVNLAGLPAMSVPCGFTQNGLPIGCN